MKKYMVLAGKAVKKAKTVSLIALLSLLLASCQKEPTACFNADRITDSVGTDFTFTNCSADADSYEWDFGDGSKTTTAGAVHSWSQVGTYTVTLTAFSKNGKKKDSASIAVTIES